MLIAFFRRWPKFRYTYVLCQAFVDVPTQCACSDLRLYSTDCVSTLFLLVCYVFVQPTCEKTSRPEPRGSPRRQDASSEPTSLLMSKHVFAKCRRTKTTGPTDSDKDLWYTFQGELLCCFQCGWISRYGSHILVQAWIS